jgi:pimeloyl-ACP methyl ester carboxylesterase
MIHGGFNSLDGILGYPFYTRLIHAGYRIITLDCRGHGRSDKPHDPESYGPEMADDVARLLDHLEVQRAHIFGYSMGGDITNKFRELHPARLLSAILGGVGRDPLKGWAAGDYDLIRLAESLEEGRGAIDYLRQPLVLEEPANTEREAQEANAWFTSKNDPLAMAAMIRGYADLKVPDKDLKNNQVPTLVIVGEFDPEKPDADALAEIMANLEYEIIPNTHHYTASSHPTYEEKVLDFLRRHASR